MEDDLYTQVQSLKQQVADMKEMTDSMSIILNKHRHRNYDGTDYLIFVTLSDVPGSYKGAAGKFVKVNSTETGLEFV